jgi:predicted nucleic acid-binding protein
VILLDTNVISELMRQEPSVFVERWFLQNEETCLICTVTIAEIAYGIAKLDASDKQSKLASQLAEWRIRFARRTLSFDPSAALIYGDVLAIARAAGKPMSVPDAQIAAIASANELQLCTRNISDFSTLTLTLINPWN